MNPPRRSGSVSLISSDPGWPSRSEQNGCENASDDSATCSRAEQNTSTVGNRECVGKRLRGPDPEGKQSWVPSTNPSVGITARLLCKPLSSRSHSLVLCSSVEFDIKVGCLVDKVSNITHLWDIFKTHREGCNRWYRGYPGLIYEYDRPS